MRSTARVVRYIVLLWGLFYYAGYALPETYTEQECASPCIHSLFELIRNCRVPPALHNGIVSSNASFQASG